MILQFSDNAWKRAVRNLDALNNKEIWKLFQIKASP